MDSAASFPDTASCEALARWLQGAAVSAQDLPQPFAEVLSRAQQQLPHYNHFRPAALNAVLSVSDKTHVEIRNQITRAAARIFESQAVAEIQVCTIPELPAYARLTTQQEREALDAGRWLDDYTAFAAQASPLTPRSFHFAAGLDIGSKAIARRLHIAVSTNTNFIYPNLYMLYIGESTRDRKSTAQNVERGLLDKAELNHLLLPSRSSAEAFMLELSAHVPPTFESWSPEIRASWLKSRSLAAQRGLLLSEAAHLLDSFSRDYSSGLLPLLLDLYDCPDPYEPKNTIGRGLEYISQPYVTIYGSTTHAAMAPHLGNAAHWGNGLFARFAIVGTDHSAIWQFWPQPLDYPDSLVRGLRFLAYELLPMPEAQFIEGEGEAARQVQLSQPLQSHAIRVEDRAWEQWEFYSKATGWDLLAPEWEDVIPQRFHPSYGRLGTTLIKVAAVLAAFDASCLPVTIAAPHTYRAQMIVENWRINLHNTAAHIRRLNINTDVQDVKAALLATKGAWVGGREIYKPLGMSKAAFERAIVALSDVVEARERQGPGPKSLEYRYTTK